MRVTFASPGRHVELHIPHDGLTMRPRDMWPAGYVSPVINRPVLMSLHDTPANSFFFSPPSSSQLSGEKPGP